MKRRYFSSFQFKTKIFLKLMFVFILLNPIGTILHEFGHIIVAKSLNYNTQNYIILVWTGRMILKKVF